jgi:thiol-disulfide isomerase/thioredoxin
MKLFKASCFVFSFITFLSTVSFAQVSRIEPAQPRWGQTLTIIYDTSAKGAALAADDEVYVAARLSFPGYGENAWARMVKSGSQLKCELKVRGDLAEIAVHFVTPNGGWDAAAYTTAIVYRPDGKPARGAFETGIKSQKYREFFEREVALYPDNYSAYRAKWATAALIGNGGADGAIKDDLAKLGRAPSETAELLCAMSFGQLMLWREDRSRELIRRAFNKYPDDDFTAQAIDDYKRLIVELALPPHGLSEIKQMEREVVSRRPRSEFARAATNAIAEEKNPAVDLIEKVSQSWIEAEPENPRPYFNLAMAYQNSYQKPERAVELIEKAIELLRSGRLRLYGDVNGRQSDRLIHTAYLIKGEIASRQGRNSDALSAVAVAAKLAPEKDGRAQLIEARIWRSMNNEARAEAAFIEAWRRGSQEAEDRLKAIYKEKHGDLKGFDEYLLRNSRSGATTGSDWKLPAPQFRVMSLDGKVLDSKSLEGRIVVLNMWFIGCGPCRKEIPKLNAVAREFRDRDVVFIAPTPDSADSLRSFLKTTPFDYQIVPVAERILDQFNTATFPTHIVIDRDGQIEALLVGAGERRPEEVRRLLLKMLGP